MGGAGGAAGAVGAVGLAVVLLGACGGDRSRSPTCGMALLIGPSVVMRTFEIPNAVIAEVPRGLPSSLPGRVVAQPAPGTATIELGSTGQLVVAYRGIGFPTPGSGYALLVVDDSTSRAEGVLVFESTPRGQAPQLGTVTDGANTVALYGVRLKYADVSNPRCPLFAAPQPEPPAQH